jgi:hypothetical protein
MVNLITLGLTATAWGSMKPNVAKALDLERQETKKSNLSPKQKLSLAATGALLAACAALPLNSTPTVPATETVSPTSPPTATETAIPDPMLEAAQNLGADWGNLRQEGEQWFYSSPDGVIVGKDVPVELSTINIDGIDRNAIVIGGQWPIAIQNEAGQWKKTNSAYIDVTKPLVDTQGNPIPLTFKFIKEDESKGMNMFLVKSGESYSKNGVEYAPVAISVDSSLDGLMFTGLLVPLDDAARGENLLRYPNFVYTQDFYSLRLDKEFKFSQLEVGEVFFLRAIFDTLNLDEKLEEAMSSGSVEREHFYRRMIEYSETFNNLFESLQERKFDNDFLNSLIIPFAYVIGIGTQ